MNSIHIYFKYINIYSMIFNSKKIFFFIKQIHSTVHLLVYGFINENSFFELF